MREFICWASSYMNERTNERTYLKIIIYTIVYNVVGGKSKARAILYDRVGVHTYVQLTVMTLMNS
jgi:hypothetical protein